ncbi:MAG: aminotransferase class III-fold pyridoxal phosphate-dependent enzyme [Deltaproteobacteria bacterium]|nr:aminotransferase class III-fold pyridoxal phosphate-dependent enzyme [Deltaproteobacteria bacterium]
MESRYAFLPGGGPELQIAGAEGCFLISAQGARILDASAGAIVSNIGHGREEVVSAAARAMAQNTYVLPTFETPERLRLVQRLQDRWLPGGLRRCLFTCGGSESVDMAIRIARQHFVSKGEPQRFRVIGRALSYHGTTLSGLDAGGHEKRRRGFAPYFSGSPKLPACYPLRCAHCRGTCNLHCADALEAALQQADPATVAAVILEPVGGSTAGALDPPREYLPRVAEICRRHGALLIADEVMCGFGRTGARFAVEHFAVVPDILVSGKGLASGYLPMGGVFVSDFVVAPIAAQGDEVMFYTFSAHPAACAAADKVLEIMEREELVQRAAKQGEALRARLQHAFADHPHVAEIRGRGMLQALELVRDRSTLASFDASLRLTSRVVAAGLANGAFFYPGGSGAAQDVICLGPPLVISDDELDLLVAVLRKSVDEVLNSHDMEGGRK